MIGAYVGGPTYILMPDAESARDKSETLLRQAQGATDLKERSRLISEAVRWHMAAVNAAPPPEDPQT